MLLAAQEAAAPAVTTFKATSRLVLLDVVVTDQHGQFAGGLSQEDFHVFEDGKPQRITSFEPPAGHPLNPATGTQVPVVIFVLDELSTTFNDMAYARNQLVHYLHTQPAHLDQPTALLVIDNLEFKVLHDYSQDRDVLLAVLAHHMPRYPAKTMNGVVTERLARSLLALQQIAAATMGMPGRKNVVWVGAGYPPINLISVHTEVKTSVEDGINRTINRLLEARVTVYPIDPSLMTSWEKTAAIDSGDPDLGLFQNQVPDLQQLPDPFDTDVNMGAFGPATGGRAFHWRNDIDKVIQSSVADGARYYTLAYVPSNRSDKPNYRVIRIKMPPGLVARTRDGYYSTDVPMTRDMVSLDVLQAAESTLPYTGLPVTVTGKAANGRIRCTLLVDAQALSWQSLSNGDSRVQVRIAMAGFSGADKRLAYEVKEMSSLTPAAKFQALLREPVAFPVEAPLSGKVKRLRFVVRDESTGHMGTVDVDPNAIPAPAEPPKPPPRGRHPAM
jgi:VWFA-related protein